VPNPIAKEMEELALKHIQKADDLTLSSAGTTDALLAIAAALLAVAHAIEGVE
jgi:hypothetical protein